MAADGKERGLGGNLRESRRPDCLTPLVCLSLGTLRGHRRLPMLSLDDLTAGDWARIEAAVLGS